jgi:CDGSH-type Zn-finger protein
MPGVVIEITKNGPLVLKGLGKLKVGDGSEIEADEFTMLCRCGASGSKPFCGGAHSKIKFTGERISDKPLDKIRSYEGKDITIHDNRVICSHAAFCIKRLPRVYRKKGRPWITPDGADVAANIELINQCPSGALSYTFNNVNQSDRERQPCVEIEKGGPYYVSGKIKLKHDNQPPNREHYALCRCGESKNKPFCDGCHYDSDFDS